MNERWGNSSNLVNSLIDHEFGLKKGEKQLLARIFGKHLVNKIVASRIVFSILEKLRKEGKIYLTKTFLNSDKKLEGFDCNRDGFQPKGIMFYYRDDEIIQHIMDVAIKKAACYFHEETDDILNIGDIINEYLYSNLNYWAVKDWTISGLARLACGHIKNIGGEVFNITVPTKKYRNGENCGEIGYATVGSLFCLNGYTFGKFIDEIIQKID